MCGCIEQRVINNIISRITDVGERLIEYRAFKDEVTNESNYDVAEDEIANESKFLDEHVSEKFGKHLII